MYVKFEYFAILHPNLCFIATSPCNYVSDRDRDARVEGEGGQFSSVTRGCRGVERCLQCVTINVTKIRDSWTLSDTSFC